MIMKESDVIATIRTSSSQVVIEDALDAYMFPRLGIAFLLGGVIFGGISYWVGMLSNGQVLP